jgi:hypothetical protein
MSFRKSRYLLGVAALILALCGLFVTFGIRALADPDNGSDKKGDSKGLIYHALGF